MEKSKFNVAKECVKAQEHVVWAEDDDSSPSEEEKVPTPRMELRSGPGNIKEETFKQLSAFPKLSLCLTWYRENIFHLCVTCFIASILNFFQIVSRI